MSVEQIAANATEAAMAQQHYNEGMALAQEWLDGAKGHRMSAMLVAATSVQKTMASAIGEEYGMTWQEVMRALASDFALLATLGAD